MRPANPASMITIAFILVSAAQAAEPSRAAEAADLRLLERYIGVFRSPTLLFDDGRTEYHHRLKYEWFDRGKTIVKFTISMAIPSQDRVLTTAEGFYGYDSAAKQLYVFGAFTHGASGWGTICEFDHVTGARTVCALTREPDGSLTEVRDAFEIVDSDTWRNTTRIRKGGSGEWMVAYQGTYSRIDE